MSARSGKPLGRPAAGRARVHDDYRDEEEAEAALRANYGLGRKVYEGAGGALGTETVYLEMTPEGASSSRVGRGSPL